MFNFKKFCFASAALNMVNGNGAPSVSVKKRLDSIWDENNVSLNWVKNDFYRQTCFQCQNYIIFI